MYRAKAEGTARHAVFDARLHTEVRARLELEEGLRKAIEEGTLELRYQPIVRTGSGAVGGFEALWRWEVDPAELVRIADASGLIAPLGRYVLREAARRAAEWDVVISVNVSARQLRDESFAASLEDALEQSGADARAPAARGDGAGHGRRTPTARCTRCSTYGSGSACGPTSTTSAGERPPCASSIAFPAMR